MLPFGNREEIFRKLVAGEIDERLDKINAYQNETNDLLMEYMMTGGTPRVIDEKMKTNTIHEGIYANYLEGVRGQWSELGKNETMLKQFAGAIIKSMTGHISWNGLAKESALGGGGTAQEYAYALHDLSVLSVIHLYGEQRKIPLIQKDRKFYFHDPFFAHIFNGWMSPGGNFEAGLRYLEDEANQSRLIEGILADHLIRLAFSMSKKKQTYDYYNHVFYWKDDKGREVDFVLYDGDRMEVPIEVKFRNKLNPRDLAPLVGFLGKTGSKKGLVVSKTALDEKADYVVVPVSVFLLLI